MANAFHLPPPWFAIERAIRTTDFTGETYSHIRQQVSDWYISVVGYDIRRYMLPNEENDMKFIDRQLTLKQMENAQLWLKHPSTNVNELTNALLTAGYKFTFTYDTKNDCVVVSIIGKARDNVNYDLCLITRHATVLQTMSLALFKHHIVHDNGLWSDQSPEAVYG